MKLKARVFNWIARHQRDPYLRVLSKMNSFLGDALANKNNNHLQNGEWEIQKRLSRLEIKTIFDVGANKGEWSDRISKIIPQAAIFSFEPVPSTFKKLEDNLSNFPQVKLFDFGLSDTEGQTSFFQFSANSLFSSKFDRIDFQDKIQVNVSLTTGDKFCQESKISSIDLMKIDVEGLEIAVLKGFENMLQKKKIRLIQFEYGPMNIESKAFLKDFYDFLGEKGYKIGKLFPNGVEFKSYHYGMDDFKWANYVAILETDLELGELLKI